MILAVTVLSGVSTVFAQTCPVFGPPTPLNTNAVADISGDIRPQLTTDGAGTWMAVWSSSDTLGGNIGTDDDILFARSTDAGVTWTAPAALNSNATSDGVLDHDQIPQLTTDGSGTWVAVWQSRNDLGGTIGTDFDIFFARSTDGGVTWGMPAALNLNAPFDGGGDLDPQITADGAGIWLVVWHSTNENLGVGLGLDSDIIFSRSTDGGVTWSTPAALNSNASSDIDRDVFPQLTTDGAGTWLAVWEIAFSPGFSNGLLLSARSIDGGLNWSAPSAINNGIFQIGVGFSQLTTDGAGTWVVVWGSDNDLGGTIGFDHDILISRSTDGGASWSPESVLNSNAAMDGGLGFGSGFDGFPQLTTDGKGTWVTLWVSNDHLGGTIGTDEDILFATSTDGAVTWSAPANLNRNAASDNDLSSDHRPQLTTDGAGTWLAVWSSDGDLGQTIGLDEDILLARFDAGIDCNGNGSSDGCDITNGTTGDCNANGVPDECDIGNGTSPDCTANGIPDECEPDCHTNGLADSCDIDNGTSPDCNTNGVPDECDVFHYAVDDGTSEAILPVVDPWDVIWLNQFTVAPGAETIDAVDIAWGPVTPGTPTTIVLWDDPNNDGDPSDAVVLATVGPVPAVNPGTNQFTTVAVPPTDVGQAGDSFFVGALATAEGLFPARLDQSSASQRRSWLVIADVGAGNINTLSANFILGLVDDLGDVGFFPGNPGNWLIRASAMIDCNQDGLPDDCAPDCNHNDIPDECDIAAGTSLDDDGNGIPDECVVNAPLPAAAPHDRKKNRYLSFDPNNADVAVALQVTMTDSLNHPGALGTSMWVGEPNADGIAQLMSTPLARLWPESTIHVTGCFISPVAEYEVRALIDEGATRSDPLLIDTIDQPGDGNFWGDTVGSFNGAEWSPSQGVTNIDDAVAVIKTWQQADGSPPSTVTDVEPQFINKVVNINDVFFVILAFQGDPYPFGCPDDPCQDTSAIPCP